MYAHMCTYACVSVCGLYLAWVHAHHGTCVETGAQLLEVCLFLPLSAPGNQAQTVRLAQ